MSSPSENKVRKPAVKVPRSREAPQSDVQAAKKQRHKELMQLKMEESINFIDKELVQTWTGLEKTVRARKYYPVRHILSVSKLGHSFLDMAGNLLQFSFSDRYCIKETLKAKKVCIKNPFFAGLILCVFVSLLPVHLIWRTFRFLVYSLLSLGSYSFVNINRFTEFDGNILVIKKTGISTRYHMIPLTKFRIEGSLFAKDKVLLNNENTEFYVYQYNLRIQTQKTGKRGRKLGKGILNKLK